MRKKGQLTLFILAAILMLIAFGIGFYYLVNANRAHANPTTNTKEQASLQGDVNVLQTQIQSCLAETSKRGIGFYGLKAESAELIKNYVDASMDDCINFQYFSDRGYTLKKEGLGSEVVITDDAVLVSLDYPIVVSKGTKIASISSFEFNIQRTKSGTLNPDGVSDFTQRIVTEDGSAEFVIPEGTKAFDAAGNPVTSVSVKVLDKNTNDLVNKVVIGSRVYEGSPDGVQFQPALPVSFIVNYEDVPRYFDPMQMTCAFYDRDADIWRTYKTVSVVDNGADKQTYTVNCLVEHFSLIAIVQCGTTSTPYYIRFAPFTSSPLDYKNDPKLASLLTRDAMKAEVQKSWMLNAPSDGGEAINLGFHIIPERIADGTYECKIDRGMMYEKPETTAGDTPADEELLQGIDPADLTKKADNEITSTAYYSGDTTGKPADQKIFTESQDDTDSLCKDYLFQDWDLDDDSAKSTVTYFESLIKIRGTDYKSYPDIKNENDLLKACYDDCAKKASTDLKPIIDAIAKLGLTDKTPGDYINDYLVANKIPLYCTATKGDCDVKNTASDPDKCAYNTPKCLVDDAVSADHPFNNMKNTYSKDSLGPTIEYPIDQSSGVRKEASFYATPKTWGYAKLKQQGVISSPAYGSLSAEIQKIGFGGFGQVMFVLQPSGSSCENSQAGGQSQTAATDPFIELMKTDYTSFQTKLTLGIFSSTAKASGPIGLGMKDTGAAGEELMDCSDNCLWTVNDELPPATSDKSGGLLRGGENYIKSYVNNLPQDALASADPVFYSQGVLKFVGMGLISTDKCGTSLRDRMFYLMNYQNKGPKQTNNIWTTAGMETNCLFLYNQWKNNKAGWNQDPAKNTNLCGTDGKDINFQDPDFLAEVPGASYCVCLRYTQDKLMPEKPADDKSTDPPAVYKCKQNCANVGAGSDGMQTPEQKKANIAACQAKCGTCATYGWHDISPNGGGADNQCPDIVDATYPPCRCGNDIVGSGDRTPAKDPSFCCGGRFYTGDDVNKLRKDQDPKNPIDLGACRNGNVNLCWCPTGEKANTNCVMSEVPPAGKGKSYEKVDAQRCGGVGTAKYSCQISYTQSSTSKTCCYTMTSDDQAACDKYVIDTFSTLPGSKAKGTISPGVCPANSECKPSANECPYGELLTTAGCTCGDPNTKYESGTKYCCPKETPKLQSSQCNCIAGEGAIDDAFKILKKCFCNGKLADPGKYCCDVKKDATADPCGKTCDPARELTGADDSCNCKGTILSQSKFKFCCPGDVTPTSSSPCFCSVDNSNMDSAGLVSKSCVCNKGNSPLSASPGDYCCQTTGVVKAGQGTCSATDCYCADTALRTCTKGVKRENMDCTLASNSKCTMMNKGDSCTGNIFSCTPEGKFGQCVWGTFQTSDGDCYCADTATQTCTKGTVRTGMDCTLENAARCGMRNEGDTCTDNSITCTPDGKYGQCISGKFVLSGGECFGVTQCSDYKKFTDATKFMDMCKNNKCGTTGCSYFFNAKVCLKAQTNCPADSAKAPIEGTIDQKYYDPAKGCWICTVGDASTPSSWKSHTASDCGSCENGNTNLPAGTNRMVLPPDLHCEVCYGVDGWKPAPGKCGCSNVEVPGPGQFASGPGVEIFQDLDHCWVCGNDDHWKIDNSKCTKNVCPPNDKISHRGTWNDAEWKSGKCYQCMGQQGYNQYWDQGSAGACGMCGTAPNVKVAGTITKINGVCKICAGHDTWELAPGECGCDATSGPNLAGHEGQLIWTSGTCWQCSTDNWIQPPDQSLCPGYWCTYNYHDNTKTPNNQYFCFKKEEFSLDNDRYAKCSDSKFGTMVICNGICGTSHSSADIPCQ